MDKVMKLVEAKPQLDKDGYSVYVFENSNYDFPFEVVAKSLEKAKLKLKLNIGDVEFEDD